MKHRSLPVLSLIFVVFLFTSPVQAQENLPRFVPADCPINVPASPEIDCGYLIVPEDHENPQGITIKLPVIIIHNRSGNPAPEAILYTDGGPAYSSLNSVWWLANSLFVEDRDIVIIEQRGNLYAEPNLECDITVLWEETSDNTACLDSLPERGINLSLYTTANIAADLDALRQALDYDTWNLFGTSYSTRLMQLVMNKQPTDIRSVVLLSAVPMTETRYQHDPEHSARVIQFMLDSCANDSACAAAYPDLENQLYNLIADLNKNPLFFELTYPGTDVKFDYEVTGDTLIGWMVGDAFYMPAYHPYKTAYLPLLISEVAAGNTDLLHSWVKEDFYGMFQAPFAWGLYFTVNCQDYAPYSNAEEIDKQTASFPELDGYFRHRGELDICEAWDLPPTYGLLSEPVTSDIPTLILGGSYDPITPPEWSRTAAVNLNNSTFVEFPSAGHNVLDGTICPDMIISEFLDDPYEDLDLNCIKDIQSAKYILPEDIIITPAIHEIHYGELGYSMLEENIFMGSLIGLVGAAILIIASGVVQRIRQQNNNHTDRVARLTQPLAIVFASLSLLWSLWLRFVLRSVAETSPITLRFGMPAVTWPIFVLAVLISIAVIFLCISILLAWKHRYWSLVQRIFVSITALSGLVFIGMLGYWGILTGLFALI
jgi:pimeloyl-ACP methyl ester carboxylesterase